MARAQAESLKTRQQICQKVAQHCPACECRVAPAAGVHACTETHRLWLLQVRQHLSVHRECLHSKSGGSSTAYRDSTSSHAEPTSLLICRCRVHVHTAVICAVSYRRAAGLSNQQKGDQQTNLQCLLLTARPAEQAVLPGHCPSRLQQLHWHSSACMRQIWIPESASVHAVLCT